MGRTPGLRIKERKMLIATRRRAKGKKKMPLNISKRGYLHTRGGNQTRKRSSSPFQKKRKGGCGDKGNKGTLRGKTVHPLKKKRGALPIL